MKQLAVLGATGSIGDSTLAVVRKHPERFKIYALSAHRNVSKIVSLIQEFNPVHVVITDLACYKSVKEQVTGAQVHLGSSALNQLVAEAAVDVVVAGIVGNAGMESVYAAAKAGKTLLLANKEAIVSAGDLIMPLARESGSSIVPLDSEHNAIYQCLSDQYQTGARPKDLKSITLTASGGPFWNTDPVLFKDITPEQAVAHPKWNMGAKISVDSATLMNKGLEVIEASQLFALPVEDIQVMVHPQSIVHSTVHFVDGSVLAQMGCPDMQIPISHGLGLGDRLSNDADFLDLLGVGQLTFHQADVVKFPCLQLAREAISAGGTAPAVLNAANEISVSAFLNRQIGFDQIPQINAKILESMRPEAVESIEQLLALDEEVRQLTTNLIKTDN